MEPLLLGRRRHCRDIVTNALNSGEHPRALYDNLVWPAMQRVAQLYRDDRIDLAAEHMATRINRTVADHLQSRLERRPLLGRRLLITCANEEPEEFSAQMCADLFEAEGWEVYLVGGGVPRDEVASLVGRLQPHVLLIFGSKPADAPGVRELIDYVRELKAAPGMNIMVSGGVFNRASGLWREVKADLFAETAAEALRLAGEAGPRTNEDPTPGAPKKRRRRRRPPLLAQLEGNA
jgi:methanogenic corrinoid protein MtbC1